MMSQKKIYEFMPGLDIPVLDIEDAINYLSGLINKVIDVREFIAIGKVQGLSVFVDVDEIGNEKVWFKEVETGMDVTPEGVHEVIKGLDRARPPIDLYEILRGPDEADLPLHINAQGENHLSGLALFRNPLVFRGQNDEGKIVEWKMLNAFSEFKDCYNGAVLFKPADIQALADKLNGNTLSENQQEELNQLRERVTELEAENETLKVPDTVPDSGDGGLTFPYSTPELEAMREAASRHWAGYSEELRMPRQKAIRMDIADALGMDSTREQRKTVELAAAIKPKEYREK